jgi:prophage DNA circulation protein
LDSARESANIEAIINMVRLMGITTAARIAVRIEYSSYDNAIKMLNKVVDAIDAHLLKLGDDAADTTYATYNISISDHLSYEALRSLRAVFVEAMIEVGASLSRVVDFTVPPVVLSSLELAHNKYNSLDREAEIINRNTPLIKHPGFLPQGKDIEILNE